MDIDVKIKRTTSLVCICSPQNPTGRVIDPEVLKGICDLIVNENNVRKDHIDSRPLYLFFDQIYSDLTQDGLFVHPLTLCPEIKDYLICVDGVSKSLNATGIRVGWAFGPKDIIGKLTEIFSHIGAWAPKAEQNAVGKFMSETLPEFTHHTQNVTTKYKHITHSICDMFDKMKGKGFRVDCQRPEGGIYISVYLDYTHSFANTEDYISYLINTCGLGIVPFEYFGSKENKGWFRISIGNIDEFNLTSIIGVIENAIIKSHTYSNSMI
jgi:aspartate aminotransferase